MIELYSRAIVVATKIHRGYGGVFDCLPETLSGSWLNSVLFDSSLDLWAVEAEDDIAFDVGDWYALEVAAILGKQLIVGVLVSFDILGNVRDAKLVEPLHFGVAKGAPGGAVNSDVRCCRVAHDISPIGYYYTLYTICFVALSASRRKVRICRPTVLARASGAFGALLPQGLDAPYRIVVSTGSLMAVEMAGAVGCGSFGA